MHTSAAAQTLWEAAHGGEGLGATLYAWGGPLVLVLVLGGLVLRARLQSRRYRALGILDAADEEAVKVALRAAEARTVGEIVPVVVERSDAHPDAELLAALLLLLAGTVGLQPHLPFGRPLLLLLAQGALALSGYLLARRLPAFARLFVRESRATATAEEQATQEFHRLGLQETAEATGVLIFVSLFERRVIVLADRGIATVVGPEEWQVVDEAILKGIAGSSLRAGLEEGIARAGELLAERFPRRPDDRNELPDRVIVRRE